MLATYHPARAAELVLKSLYSTQAWIYCILTLLVERSSVRHSLDNLFKTCIVTALTALEHHAAQSHLPERHRAMASPIVHRFLQARYLAIPDQACRAVYWQG